MRFDRISGLVVAVVVLLAGSAYAFQRTVSWTSDAQVVLVPTKVPAGESSPFDSFVTGGTLGTTVELLASPDLAQRVPHPGVSFTARAVADSRVIALHASGPEDVVQPALAALLVQAGPAQQRLADRWQLRALTRPTAAAPGGPTMPMMLVAVALLAALAGVGATTAVRRLLPQVAERRLRVRRGDRPTADAPTAPLLWNQNGDAFEPVTVPKPERRSAKDRIIRPTLDAPERTR